MFPSKLLNLKPLEQLKGKLKALSFVLVGVVLLAALSPLGGVLLPSQLLFILILLASFIFFLTLKPSLKLNLAEKSFLFLLLLLLLLFFSSVWVVGSLLTVLLFFAYFLMFFLASRLTQDRLVQTVYALVSIGTVVAAVTSVKYLLKAASVLPVSADALILIAFFSLIIPILIGLLLYEEKEVYKFWLALALVINLAALVLTFSQRISIRFDLWQTAWHIFIQRPLFGFGPGTFSTVLPQLQMKPTYAFFADNSYLQFALESGFFALALLFLTLAFVFKLSWQKLNCCQPKEKHLHLFLLLALAIFLALNLVASLFYLPAVGFLFWLLAGLAVAPVNQVTPKEETKNAALRGLLVFAFSLLFVVTIFAYIGAAFKEQADSRLRSFSYAEGRRLAKLAVKFFPFNAEAYATLAKAYVEPIQPQKYIKEAIKAQKKAVKLRPTWPYYYAHLADYLDLAGAPFSQVWLNYQKAIKLYPLEVQLKVKAGNWLLKQRQYKKATFVYAQAVALSQLYQADKKTAKSLTKMRPQTAAKVRSIGLAYLGLAKSYAYLDRLKLAQANLQQAERLLGKVAGVIFARGLLKEKQKQWPQALVLFEQAAKKSLFLMPEINYRLAVVRLKLGDKDKAIKELKKLRKTDPHFQPAKTLLKQLKMGDK